MSLYTYAVTCKHCKGAGYFADSQCPDCDGVGLTFQNHDPDISKRMLRFSAWLVFCFAVAVVFIEIAFRIGAL
jgi:hypothetical protein